MRVSDLLLLGSCALPMSGLAAQQPVSAIHVEVPDTTRLAGLMGSVEFQVSAETPHHFRLVVTPLGGASVLVDSTSGSVRTAILSVVPVGASEPRFKAGGYWVDVVGATPDGRPDTVRFSAVFVTPPLILNAVPDPSEMPPLRPELRRTPLATSIVSGVVTAAATIAAGRIGRPSEIDRAGVSTSGKPIMLGVSLGALVGIGSQVLKGRRDPGAVTANRFIRDEFNQQRDLIISSNDFARASYEGMVILRRVAP